MTDTLREFIAKVDKHIAVIFEIIGEVHPMWHCVTASGEHRVVASPSDDKDAAAIMMRIYFQTEKIARYVFVGEAWQLEASNDELPAIMRRGVANYPGRIEILMYSAEDEIGSLTAHRVITRRKRKAKLGPLEFTASKCSVGRLVGMLPVKGTVQ